MLKDEEELYLQNITTLTSLKFALWNMTKLFDC